MFVKNMVKVYPNRLKIIEYRKGYHKSNPDESPIDRWAYQHQYIQDYFKDTHPPVYEEPEYVQPNFVQVPMPLSPAYKHFKALQDARMGIMARNELQALIRRSELQSKSLKRTKSNIFDYIACNDFDLFITFSFATDRYDIDSCQKRMMTWLDNQQKIHKRKGYEKFKYVLVMEYHKDGALHFHGLFKDYRGKLEISRNPHTGLPVIQKGKRVYNLRSFTHGFTNVTRIVNQEATGRYVTKYVTKDLVALAGRKRYWASRGLNIPPKLYNEDIGSLEREVLYETDGYTISHSHDKLPKSSD